MRQPFHVIYVGRIIVVQMTNEVKSLTSIKNEMMLALILSWKRGPSGETLLAKAKYIMIMVFQNASSILGGSRIRCKRNSCSDPNHFAVYGFFGFLLADFSLRVDEVWRR